MTIVRHAIDFPPLSPTARAALAGLDTTLLSDALGGKATAAAAFTPLSSRERLVGQARTAFCPGSVLPAIGTITLARPGEVLVIGGGGDSFASLGGIMARDAVRQRLAGLVIDGLVRDIGELRAMPFPIFCRGATPHGAGADPRGAIDGPVNLGGPLVYPGDVIVGDDDGIVVIPLAQVDEVVAKAIAKRDAEASWIADIEAGKSLAEVHGFDVPKSN